MFFRLEKMITFATEITNNNFSQTMRRKIMAFLATSYQQALCQSRKGTGNTPLGLCLQDVV